MDLEHLAKLIDEKIAQNLDISYYDEDHIKLGDEVMTCDGSRFHVNNTSEIKNFSLVKRFVHDPVTNTYCLIGLVDSYSGDSDDLENRNTRYFLTRKCINEDN